jgi:hypothetical protein
MEGFETRVAVSKNISFDLKKIFPKKNGAMAISDPVEKRITGRSFIKM